MLRSFRHWYFHYKFFRFYRNGILESMAKAYLYLLGYRQFIYTAGISCKKIQYEIARCLKVPLLSFSEDPAHERSRMEVTLKELDKKQKS